MNKNIDLNAIRISTDCGDDENLADFSTKSKDGSVFAYFKNLRSNLIAHIDAADVVVGCVAWLTDFEILKALSRKRGVSIIVQKEDWLRPDISTDAGWKAATRNLYESLPATLSRYDDSLNITAVHMMSYGGDPTIEAVRCVGNHNSDRNPSSPRSHHKFVVFCRREEGSYNLPVLGLDRIV